jgi:outer membrane protein
MQNHLWLIPRALLQLIAAGWLLAPSLVPAQDDPSPRRGTSGQSQGRFLGLKQAVEMALEHHPLLQVARADHKAAEARTEQTRSLYYPQVFADFATAAGVGGINPRFVTPAGSMLRKNLSQYTGGVIANQRLYDFGFTRDLVESSDLAARAFEQNVHAQRALVMLNVHRAYLNSLKQRRLVQIAEDTVRQRGIIRSQVETLYRQQLKSKLDLDLVQVELTNAEAALVRARNNLKASFAELNRAMGITGPDDYVLEEIPIEITSPQPLEALIAKSLTHPELKRAQEQARSAEAKLRAARKQYLPTVTAVASAGDFQAFDPDRGERTGGWWAASAVVSFPLFTGFLIENQVREASAQHAAALASISHIEQALTQQVTNAYLDTLTFAEQVKLAEEQVKTAQEALLLARQRYKLGLGSIVEVTQSEVAVTAAQTRLAEAQYDYKIAEVTLAYATGTLPILDQSSSPVGTTP